MEENMSAENKKFDAGVSKTPAREPLNITTTIDYLKFRFDLDSDKGIKKFESYSNVLLCGCQMTKDRISCKYFLAILIILKGSSFCCFEI